MRTVLAISEKSSIFLNVIAFDITEKIIKKWVKNDNKCNIEVEKLMILSK